MSAKAGSVLVVEDWASPEWRLDHLYTIVDPNGREVPFVMNDEQRQFVANLHDRNAICKARQLGYSTLLCLMALDQCLFNRNFNAAIIAHSLDDAGKLFRTKIRFAWERLPDLLRSHIGLRSETASGMVFGNGSAITVDTSARSQTLQFLHISEFGKICAKFPERAKEIVTGSFPAVSPGGLITIESTAEGQEGYFYEITMAALAAQQERRALTPLDFRLHFAPWWAKPDNRLDPEGVVIPAEMERYFSKLEAKGIRLDAAQRAWYVKTEETLHEDIRREHPSYPEEAFEVSIEGTVLHHQMALLRKHDQITAVPWDPAYPVNTFWDLGTDDATAIWCHQRVGLQNRLIRYFEDSGQGLGYYANELRSHGFTFGQHYLPHDADHDIQGESIEKRADILRRLLPGEVRVVDRIREIGNGIETLREFLPSCWMDKANCADGIKALDAYRYEWDEKLGRWKSAPLHNWACLGPDTRIRTLSGWRRIADLVGTEFHVWGYSEAEGRLVPARAAKCWLSKRNADVVRVTIDDGRHIVCTPDHLFLTRTGQWVEAQALQPGLPLMPFYERFDSDYIKVKLTDGSVATEHQYVFARLCGSLLDGHHVHHVDDDKGNNDPSNLRQLTIFDHRSLHSKRPEHVEHLNRIRHSRGNTAVLVAVNKMRIGDVHHTRQKEYWTDERLAKHGAASRAAFRRSETVKVCPGCDETFLGNWRRLYCCKNCKARLADHRGRETPVRFAVAHKHSPDCQRTDPQNHKVVSVERLGTAMDVYDIEVPGIHNFVAEGVVVHNSHAADALRQGAQGYRPIAAEPGFTRHRSSWRA